VSKPHTEPGPGAVVELDPVVAEVRAGGPLYREVLRVPALSAGVYRLPARTRDPQSPHREDEIYYVLSGRASIAIDGVDHRVGPGSLVYVRAAAEHRFHSIESDLDLLVVFAPAESG
jgi:mannose-6-phosphate isomerase-like protein (cupin superfamily)